MLWKTISPFSWWKLCKINNVCSPDIELVRGLMRSASVLETGWHKQIKNIVNRVLQIYYIYSLHYMNTFTQNIIHTLFQGCWSAFLFCGSASSCFSQCRSRSSCFLNADPDPALKKFVKNNLMQSFFSWQKQKRLLKSKK